jgi:hypothetical protein
MVSKMLDRRSTKFPSGVYHEGTTPHSRLSERPGITGFSQLGDDSRSVSRGFMGGEEIHLSSQKPIKVKKAHHRIKSHSATSAGEESLDQA